MASVTPDSANMLLAFLLLLAIAMWAMQTFGNVTHAAGRRWAVRTGAEA